MEAAQRFLEAKERYPVGSKDWAKATAMAFDMLMREECAEMTKPEWWNDKGLKALSARVVKAAPNDDLTHDMRAMVLSGQFGVLEAGPRSAGELAEAVTHYERSVELTHAPAMKALLAERAEWCRHKAGRISALSS